MSGCSHNWQAPMWAQPLVLAAAPAAAKLAVARHRAVPAPAKAAAAEPRVRRRALDAVRDEIRRVLLGYDANPARGESLLAFLDAPLPEEIPADFLHALAKLRRELPLFVDIERLFIRAPRASVAGELGASNNASLRVYLRRMQAQGAGLPEEFLDLLRSQRTTTGQTPGRHR